MAPQPSINTLFAKMRARTSLRERFADNYCRKFDFMFIEVRLGYISQKMVEKFFYRKWDYHAPDPTFTANGTITPHNHHSHHFDHIGGSVRSQVVKFRFSMGVEQKKISEKVRFREVFLMQKSPFQKILRKFYLTILLNRLENGFDDFF